MRLPYPWFHPLQPLTELAMKYERKPFSNVNKISTTYTTFTRSLLALSAAGDTIKVEDRWQKNGK